MKKLSEEIKNMGLYENANNNALREEYIKALKSNDFKSLISTIDIAEEELMKHTSKLEAAAFDFGNCNACKCVLECKNKLSGFKYCPSVLKNRIIFSYVACPYKQKEIKENAYQKNVYNFNEPKEIKKASMKDIYTDDKNRFEVIKWLKDFISNYPKNKVKGLYLSGNFGCGKTYFIAAMFNELAKRDVESAIVYYPEFLRDLKASFDEDFGEKFNYIKTVPLLLFDDVGAEHTTAWSRDEILGPILQYRMQEELPTFFTSNLNINELENHFATTTVSVEKIKARRIIERIKQLTDEQEMISKNRRN
jgi:primosomal protein DnaI